MQKGVQQLEKMMRHKKEACPKEEPCIEVISYGDFLLLFECYCCELDHRL